MFSRALSCSAGTGELPFAAGNYLASTRTAYSVPRYDGAFDDVARDTPYTLSYKKTTDGLTKTVFAGEINHSFDLPLPTVSTSGPANFGAGFAWAPGYWFVAFGHMVLDSYDPDTGFVGTAATFNNNEKYFHPISARTLLPLDNQIAAPNNRARYLLVRRVHNRIHDVVPIAIGLFLDAIHIVFRPHDENALGDSGRR